MKEGKKQTELKPRNDINNFAHKGKRGVFGAFRIKDGCLQIKKLISLLFKRYWRKRQTCGFPWGKFNKIDLKRSTIQNEVAYDTINKTLNFKH